MDFPTWTLREGLLSNSPSAEIRIDAQWWSWEGAHAHEGWALVRIRTECAGSGWVVDGSTVWSADGRLVALVRQSRVVRARPADGTANS
ncbi:hypothetical protein [Streptomyces sp. NPDC059010]|uniref:hypothetical protein n=1 Tax=Streptomyces sp. NPDC059010 TaxID=3346695 RepID=UPI0036ACB11E